MSWGQSSSPSTRYLSFIAQWLESHDKECRFNELEGRRIRGCFHGWLILSNQSNLWSLWNPLTSKLVHLPPLIHRETDSYGCCLSSPPDEQGSILLLLPDITPSIVFCRLDRKRKRLKWIEMSYAKQIRSISGVDCFLQSLTCCNGKIYAMSMNLDYEFVTEINIVVNGEEVVISLLPVVKLPHHPTSGFDNIYCFLKGSCTELFYIAIYIKDDMRIRDVYLFKLDMTSMMWEEMEDLKDAIFFMKFSTRNSYFVFYKSLVAREIAGYVYILDEMDRIISFHVRDRTMTVSSRQPLTVQESQVVVWAMLDCGLEVDHPKSKQVEEYTDNKRTVRRVNIEFDSTTSDSQLLSLPFHILKMIMELCVGVEYMRFRATCKSCYIAAPLIQWSNKTTLKRLQMYSLSSPWLMILDHSRGIITFIDPICGDKYFIKTPQELNDGYKVYCSRYGWLLMYNSDGLMVFFNPFTSDIHKLPKSCCLTSLCFSSPPTSPDCIVAGFTRPYRYGAAIRIHFVSQEPSWRTYYLDFGANDPYSFHFPTFSGQDVYALCNNNKRIEAFREMSREHFSRVMVVDEAPRTCRTSPAEYFLSICDEHLLLVIVGVAGESVEVFKLNDSTKEWEMIDDLGKHVIYISDVSCICLEATSPEMENKIYFPRLLDDNKDMKIVFYSLETCKYHTFDEKNVQESFAGDLSETKDYGHCDTIWIEPSWS